MKKLFVIFLFSCFVGITQAQNFQALYGYGNEKPVNFVTAELFKPLDHGALYYFTDFKIDGDGYFESYTEISKYWNISKKHGVAVTAQYNAGIGSFESEAIKIVPVYLLGIQKSILVNEWVLSLDVLYRIDKFTNSDGVQLTFQYGRTWNRLSFSGYCDVWNSGKYDVTQSPTVILIEPQLFYRLTKRISIGGELRFSNYTLLAPYDSYAMCGIKWNLEN